MLMSIVAFFAALIWHYRCCPFPFRAGVAWVAMAHTSRKNNIFECGGQRKYGQRFAFECGEQHFAPKYGGQHPAYERGGKHFAFKYGEQHFSFGYGGQRAVPTSVWLIFGKAGQ